jgi:hypothetical protein
MEDLVAGEEIDTGSGDFAPALRGQQRDRGGELSQTEERPLTGDGRRFYPGYSSGVQERGEALKQSAVVAADVEDALDRRAHFRLNMPEQT